MIEAHWPLPLLSSGRAVSSRCAMCDSRFELISVVRDSGTDAHNPSLSMRLLDCSIAPKAQRLPNQYLANV